MRVGERRGLSLEAVRALECLRRISRTIPLKPPPGFNGTVAQYKTKRSFQLAHDRKRVLNKLKATLARERCRKARLRSQRENDETWPAEVPPAVLVKAKDGGPGYPILSEPQYSQGQSTADMEDPQTTPNPQVVDGQEVTDDTKRHQKEPAAQGDANDDIQKIVVTLDTSGVRVTELPEKIREFFEKNARKEVWVRGMVKGPASKQMIIDVPEGVTEGELLFYLPWCGKRNIMGSRIYMMPDDTDIVIRQRGWDGQLYTRLYELPRNVEVRDMYGSQHMPEGRIDPMQLIQAHRITSSGDLVIYVDNSRIDELMELSPQKLEETEDRNLQLLACERVLALHLRSMLEAGRALHKVRKQRLYLSRDMTFMQYCRTFWGMSRAHADRLIAYVEVAEILRPIASAKALCHEGHLRPLTKVRKADGTLDACTIRVLWNRAVRMAKPPKYLAGSGSAASDGTYGGVIVTAADVAAVVNEDSSWRGEAFARCRARVICKKRRKPEVVVRLNTEDPDSTAVLMFQTFDHGYLVKVVIQLLKFFKKPAPDCSW
jgi:hypothetical protein